MEILKPVKKTENAVIDIICDSCGKSCKIHTMIIDNDLREDNGQTHHIFEYMKLEANFGYFSKKDGETWTAHICENCIVEKLVPIIKFKKVLNPYV